MIGLIAWAVDAAKRLRAGAAKDQAYIAVTKDGFVDGACFSDSPDAEEWACEMERAGMIVKRVARAEAKRVLFTQIPSSH